MKKIFTLIALIGFAQYGKAQTVAGADMETWKTYTSSSITLERPEFWFSSDSLIRFYYFITASTTTYTPRVTKSTTVKHGGTMSAKLESTATDTLPTILANSNISFKMADILAGKFIYKYTGGTAVTKRMVDASAWIQFATASADEGTMSVQAIKVIGGQDSVVGKGTSNIAANTAFTKFTTPITYVDATVVPERIIISFIPSKKTNPATGNVMYVDDVAMTSPVGIETPLLNDIRINVYPNPAANQLHISAGLPEALTIAVYNVSGQVVFSRPIGQETDLDISALGNGNYIYVISGQDNGVKYYGSAFTKQ